MLLPSPISFEVGQQVPSSNCQTSSSRSLFSPPTSPTAQTSTSSIFSTCRALQSILATPPHQFPPTPQASPTMLHSPAPLSSKSRMRSENGAGAMSPTMKVAKQPLVIRSNKKRGREVNNEEIETSSRRESVSTVSEDGLKNLDDTDSSLSDLPSTPKRSRIAPEAIPFGLARSDYHELHLKSMSEISKRSTPFTFGKQRSKSLFSTPPPPPLIFNRQYSSSSSSPPATNESSLIPSSATTRSSSPSPFYNPRSKAATGLNSEGESADEVEEGVWDVEDDKMLIELVLEKLKLSKSEWDECARSLGRDSGSVNKRWKSLLAGDKIGLKQQKSLSVGGSIGLKQHKTGRKRSKIPDTWR